ncbi:GAF domain-containing protein [Agrilactobacillus fermenti]|uniref:GAF domain-containing protein n=1 Tax=Agrilactobacillus fermenti TaxID=2586909 RepID=UPI001E5F57D3|nr:GAF domain-containing protein [Agrilactobacillus fermenti]MCD2255681.1 GAF domain-containing protein [Agrilactobacillus fermenti]
MADLAEQSQYDSLVQKIYQDADFDFVGVAIQDRLNGGQIRWRHVIGNISQRYRRIILRTGLGIAGLVIRTGEPYFDNHLDQQPQEFMYTPITVVEKLTAAAAIPIVDPTTQLVTGVLLAGYRDNRNVTHATIAKLGYYLKHSEHHQSS